LRKVLGEENPADLLTKHSNSRQRLGELVTLFGCKYLDGRAASAPQVRKGESSKVTMASAPTEDADEDEVAAVQEEIAIRPCMPHLAYPAHELDARYPPLSAPPDEGLVDVVDDKRDAVYQHGLGIAEDIRAEVAAQGRKRRPDANVICAVTSDPAEAIVQCPVPPPPATSTVQNLSGQRRRPKALRRAPVSLRRLTA